MNIWSQGKGGDITIHKALYITYREKDNKRATSTHVKPVGKRTLRKIRLHLVKPQALGRMRKLDARQVHLLHGRQQAPLAEHVKRADRLERPLHGSGGNQLGRHGDVVFLRRFFRKELHDRLAKLDLAAAHGSLPLFDGLGDAKLVLQGVVPALDAVEHELALGDVRGQTLEVDPLEHVDFLLADDGTAVRVMH